MGLDDHSLTNAEGMPIQRILRHRNNTTVLRCIGATLHEVHQDVEFAVGHLPRCRNTGLILADHLHEPGLENPPIHLHDGGIQNDPRSVNVFEAAKGMQVTDINDPGVG